MGFSKENAMPPPPAPVAGDCWYLTGPTAAGKTKVGVELALRLGAEIISLDSMALYQGMDIGTAKPFAEDRARVPHHLLDLVPPTEEFSLSEYIDAAQAAICQIKSRGRTVLFVGGTPLYLKSLLRGVYQGPPADWLFRRQIESELKTLPLEALHQRLQVIDPLLAAKLHPHDKRRIIRGLEVFKLTGQRLSHLQTQFDEGRPASQVKVFVLSWPREELHRRIDARVEQMFATGLVDEVRGLLAKYGALSRTAVQAVGYREVIDFVQSGDWTTSPRFKVQSSKLAKGGAVLSTQYLVQSTTTEVRGSPHTPPKPSVSLSPDRPLSPSLPAPSLAACIDRVKARTRRFARRQETWFRALSECTFVPMQPGTDPAEVARSIVALAAGSAGSPL
jgi:tRNA dimethylallyltransferase